MTNETKQPFAEQPPRRADDSQLVERVLGTQEAGEMRELTGGKVSSHEELDDPQIEIPNDIIVTTAELEAIREHKRQEYIEWAEKIGKDDKWVGGFFDFNLDKGVVCKGNLDLSNCGASELPAGLIMVKQSLFFNSNNMVSLESMPLEVGGYLLLAHNQLISIKGLPRRVGKDLSLYSNQIVSLEGMPDYVGGGIDFSNNKIVSINGLPNEVNGELAIGSNPIESLDGLPKIIRGDLTISNILATSIPAGITITGKIYIKEFQTELVADCKAKGYEIKFC